MSVNNTVHTIEDGSFVALYETQLPDKDGIAFTHLCVTEVIEGFEFNTNLMIAVKRNHYSVIVEKDFPEEHFEEDEEFDATLDEVKVWVLAEFGKRLGSRVMQQMQLVIEGMELIEKIQTKK